MRLDTAMYRGLEVGLEYDPMLGKLIVWGADRDQAIRRMIRAIQEMNVGGVHTALPAALQVLEHEKFVEGDFDTHFLEGMEIRSPEQFEGLAAVAAAIYRHKLAKRRALGPSAGSREGWAARSRSETTSLVQRAGMEVAR